jgi:hypothetical protein
VRERFGWRRNKRRGRAYGDAVGLGIGILVMVITISLLFWMVRKMTRETGSAIPVPEEGVEDALLERSAVPPEPASAEDISPREEPPPGEERPERREATSTTSPTPREEPPPGEERPEKRTP